jgi:hypothetical protein
MISSIDLRTPDHATMNLWGRKRVRRGATAIAGFVAYLGGVAVALAWLQSSFAHLSNPYFFLSSIYQYELVGPTVGEAVAIVLPYLQLVLAVCLIARFFYGGALLSSAVLLTLFFAIQTSAVSRGLNISCGCFGASLSKSVGAESLGSVAVLLCVAVGSYYVQQRIALATGLDCPSD